MLPDNVLLQIFNFYRNTSYIPSRHQVYPNTWKWHVLVHVCQRWRQLVFASPLHLRLRIHCTIGTPVRENLAIWPPFPITMDYYSRNNLTPNDEDNIVATLRHPDRVCFIRLNLTGSQSGKMLAMMQEPFPVLTHLNIVSRDGNTSVLPAGFLGGSAPRLQTFDLHGIPFPTLPTLLLSASDLLSLGLTNIPPTGYILPEAMATCLAALPRLESFSIGFQSTTSRPDRIRPLPVTRTVLPALRIFYIKGTIEYLEDLVSQIDCPQLKHISIDYLGPFVDFQVTQLAQFIHYSVCRTTPPRHAAVSISSHCINFGLNPGCVIDISPESAYWQVFHMTQVLLQFSATLFAVVRLELGFDEDRQLEGTDDVEWLHLLHQFPTVQTLRVYGQLARHIALALESVTGEMVPEVLPSLDLICLQDQPAPSVEKFVTARRLSGRSITVINTYIEYTERIKSYGG